MRIVGGLVLIALLALVFAGSTPADPKIPPYGDPKEKREKPPGKNDGKVPAETPKFDPDSVPETTPLTPAMDPSIVLPEADLALPVPKGLTERPVLVIRASKDGWLPAYLLPEKRFVPVKNQEGLRQLVYERAEAAGRSSEPPCESKLDIVLLVDHRAPWARFLQMMLAGSHPSNRVYKYWLGVKGPKGGLGLLPRHLDFNRGLMMRPESQHDPSKVVERRGRIITKKGPGAFASKDLLYRWCYDLWKSSGETPIGLSLAAGSATPYGAAVAVLNEVRRFGFAHAVVASPGFEATGSASGSGYFSVGKTVPEIERKVPPLRPGVVLSPHREYSVRFPWIDGSLFGE